MTARYELINTMSALPGDSFGTVMTTHRTVEAALAMMGRISRMTSRANGSNAYLPMIIVDSKTGEQVEE